MSFERKSLRVELKAEDEGAFSAVFATFDVVDHDGDVTKPGAFKQGVDVVIGAYGHDTWQLPTGKGALKADQREATVDGRFFLDTTHGLDTYRTVKNLGPLQEWSYIYNPTKVSFGEFDGRRVRFLEEIEVFSVDPVLAGAGIDTRTTGIKSRGGAPTIAQLDADLKSAIARLSQTELTDGERKELGEIAARLREIDGLLHTTNPKQMEETRKQFLRFQRSRLAGVA